MSRTRSAISCTRSAASGDRNAASHRHPRESGGPGLLHVACPGFPLARESRVFLGGAMKLAIDYALCNSCGLCREVCPESAVRPKLLEPRHLYEIMPEKCTGCGECLPYCPAPGALVQVAVA